MNYSEHNGCRSCLEKGSYLDLNQTTAYNCDQQCLCRNSNERTAFDRDFYNFYMKGQLKPLPQMKQMSKSGSSCREGYGRDK